MLRPGATSTPERPVLDLHARPGGRLRGPPLAALVGAEDGAAPAPATPTFKILLRTGSSDMIGFYEKLKEYTAS